MPDDQAAPNEEVELRNLQGDLRSLVKQLNALSRLKPGSANSLDKLERALKVLPTTDTIASAIDDIRRRAAAVLKSGQQRRVEGFRRIEADLIHEARKVGKPVRELDQGWRVGEFEVQFRRSAAMARILYNREPVTGWSSIGARNHLDRLLARASTKLQSVSLSDEALEDVYWRGYEHAARTATAARRGRVRLADLFRSVQTIVGSTRDTAPNSKQRKQPGLQRFAFLHNLDRYRRIAGTIPAERRLLLETGSQVDSAKFGMVLNGLDPAEDYRVYCYAVRAPQTS